MDRARAREQEAALAGRCMLKIVSALLGLTLAAGAAEAASAVNLDDQPRTIVVLEGGDRFELRLGASESAEFCISGCFVTLPNGERAVLNGTETLEISNGAVRIW